MMEEVGDDWRRWGLGGGIKWWRQAVAAAAAAAVCVLGEDGEDVGIIKLGEDVMTGGRSAAVGGAVEGGIK